MDGRWWRRWRLLRQVVVVKGGLRALILETGCLPGADVWHCTRLSLCAWQPAEPRHAEEGGGVGRR